LVNMNGFETRSVTELSGGEQQRVALARALAPRPRLLMFDEPLGALDRTLKEELLAELRTILRTTRVPAIYVTHDQEEAFSIADRILILRDGKIIRAGSPRQLLEHPESAWVARFLGLGNVLDGTIVAKKGRKWSVKTSVGMLDVICGKGAKVGDAVSLLIRPGRVKRAGGPGSLKSRVSDVVFQMNGYHVTLDNGLVIDLDRAPKVRENIEIRLETPECLE
jgi:ABC-type Fe3+/spermidine/putrescine transport system ATPase subunit